MNISVNGYISELIGEKINVFVKAVAEAESIIHEMDNGYGDALNLALCSVKDAYGELLTAYIYDAIDAQIVQSTLTSYQQVKSYQHLSERKAK